MKVFEVIEKHWEHEEVIFCTDKDVGLKAIIAVHNTALGPALGGLRMWNYKSEDEALVDVLRLSKGMTYKAAVAGLNLGGGKAVIIGDPKTQKTEALFRAFGQFVNSMNGRYITAEDVGTNEIDMGYVFMETPWVTGIAKHFGGSGDPSPLTAHGVLMGIKASLHEKTGSDSLKGIRVNVQGLGSVGSNLIPYLVAENAVVTVADIDPEKVNRMMSQYNVKSTSPEDILYAECEVLAPCAMGAVFNDQTIPKLKCQIIAGGANNQLAEDRHANMLRELGILYAPDYVINAGGLINVFVELEGYSRERSYDITRNIYDQMKKVFAIAKAQNITTKQAADHLAEERIKQIGNLRTRHPGKAQRAFTTLKIENR